MEKERIWQNWDKSNAAASIDQYWLASEGGWRNTLTNHIELLLGKEISILEVGCGTGLIGETLLNKGIAGQYMGGDVSVNMLDIAKKRLPNTSLINLDIFDISVQDQFYENVICIHVLQHLPDYREALRELIRITKKNLYIASWFNTNGDSQINFSAPSDKWGGQRFYNNRYSLPNFIKDIYLSGREDIRDIVVHRFYNDANYSVCIKFDSVE